jgi:hypothetical protein
MTTRRFLRGREVVGRPLRSCAHSSHASRIGSPGAVDALAGEFDPLALIDALARHEIDYVIVGGVAAMHHGATRRTDDLDICPRWSAENLDRLAAALRELGAELAVAPRRDDPRSGDRRCAARSDGSRHLADPVRSLRRSARPPQERGRSRRLGHVNPSGVTTQCARASYALAVSCRNRGETLARGVADVVSSRVRW